MLAFIFTLSIVYDLAATGAVAITEIAKKEDDKSAKLLHTVIPF